MTEGAMIEGPMIEGIAPALAEDLRHAAGDLMEEAVAIRCRIHAEPELGLDLPRTQELVVEQPVASACGR